MARRKARIRNRSFKGEAERRVLNGEHLAVCQRTGRECWSSELRQEWNGLWVHYSVWERKQPQYFVRGEKEDIAVKEPVVPVPATEEIEVTFATPLGTLPTDNFGNDELD